MTIKMFLNILNEWLLLLGFVGFTRTCVNPTGIMLVMGVVVVVKSRPRHLAKWFFRIMCFNTRVRTNPWPDNVFVPYSFFRLNHQIIFMPCLVFMFSLGSVHPFSDMIMMWFMFILSSMLPFSDMIMMCFLVTFQFQAYVAMVFALIFPELRVFGANVFYAKT